MLFVPFTVPTFPATHHQTTHPAHQSHHQQLQANTQNPVQQPQQLTQLNQLSHLNHQGIVPATTNQPTIHSTSCSPQQQATTPNKQQSVIN
ncbi:PREDICTED: TOX high mobility group box family member 3-like [Dinoponera quadriceps]|uniref:TOX high mobility group box family member 3-like n=1 Tax=Dinoponera quadriceps TaxID=609295 RepID=A0A6P3Y3M3_DINQU|nr:PREDICTED: TOX high mobility group box family member 3-like [Dinoponera quadriceps]